MVGDTGTEAGNKRQRGPASTQGMGGTPVDAGIHRARKEGVCVRAAGGAGETLEGFVCVRGAAQR